MKKIVFILILIFNTFLLASNAQQISKTDKEVQKQVEREKMYAKEKKFYQGKQYDLKSFEVSADSIKSLPTMDVDYSSDDDVLEME